MKLYHFIDECLSRIGVEKVFGIPGALVMPIWQNITYKEIILCSHEQEASYVATGYSKKSLKPVCVITTGGPGTTNCISGIASANIDSVPLIYISGRTPVIKNGKGLRQEESKINRLYDSTDLLCGITKQSVCIDEISTAPSIIWNTIKMAVEHRQGAVHISIPIDIQRMDIGDFDFENQMKLNDSNVDACIEISEKPLFVIGWGAWMSNSYRLIYKLAESVNAPVVVSSKAYCCINYSSDMFLGKLGYGYNDALDRFLGEYRPDSILSFGSSLGEKDIKKNSVIDELISSVSTYMVADEIEYINERNRNIKGIFVNDMQDYLRKMLTSLKNVKQDKSIIEKIRFTRDNAMKLWEEKIFHDDYMAQCINLVGKEIDEDCVVFADAGNNLANAGALIMPKQFGQMFIDVGLRAMGTGICSAVGMAIADKFKKYIAITGDGCMMMNGNVMHLASELKLPVVFIVFNNHSLGRVRVGQSIMNDYRATDINNVDLVSYAQAFGIKAYSCDSLEGFSDVLSCVLKKSNNQKSGINKETETCLIEVITSKDEIPVPVKDNIY